MLGFRHATDADHVVAITTIVSREKGIKNSSLIGLLWGLGHSITVTFVAIPIMFFSLVIPQKLALGLEFTVGLMLVVLGIFNFLGVTSKITKHLTPRIHKHEHESILGKHHSHLHVHFLNYFKLGSHHIGLFHTIRPVIIGLVHGLAGSAAVALLIISTIKDPKFAVFYLFVFHIGVIIGMMLITTGLGTSIALAESRSRKIHKYLVLISGIFSFVFGLILMYETGIQGGLFSQNL